MTGQPSDRLGEDFSEQYKEFTERWFFFFIYLLLLIIVYIISLSFCIQYNWALAQVVVNYGFFFFPGWWVSFSVLWSEGVVGGGMPVCMQ